ncbi:hypothetical protein ABZX64_28820 [Streptomyces misionensis]|uniref:hypothetical protein n=1 Tax=Streptomyces misionensis TaxID=67331 RepID=UPI0033BAB14D
MTTAWRTARRSPAPLVAAPREPVDPARIGRRVVRRRAKGMDASAPSGTVYDPDTDDVVQAELAADAAAAAREAELREAARIAARADELQALRDLGNHSGEPAWGEVAAVGVRAAA